MNEKLSDIEYILDYSLAMQEDFKKFFIQNKFYDQVVKKQRMAIEPNVKDIDLAHNHYLKVIYNVQLLKLSLIGDQIIQSVKSKNFLSYALAGRSLLEQIAVWRYFLVEKYSKFFKSGKEITFEDFLEIISIHKKFLYGTRFDWLKWIGKDFDALNITYQNALSAKKDKKNTPHNKENISVNVLTCVEKISVIHPQFGVYYEMFCDLVHPNFGSNIFLAGINANGEVEIDASAKIQLGMKLIEETFGKLIFLTYGQINELTKSHFSMLLGEPSPNFLTVDFLDIGLYRKSDSEHLH